MLSFRNETPKHRSNRRVCAHYKSYKKTLRSDFNMRCGYCNDLDTNRIRNFVIDHFVPQNPDGWTHTIPSNTYKNLIYACPFCNGAKSNKWPTNNEKLHNNGIQGFVKPTLKLYSNMFRRDNYGRIIVHKAHPIGIYIYDELSFDFPIHSLNWRFEKILEQEKIIEALKVQDSVLGIQLNDLKILRLEIVDSIYKMYNAE